MGKLDALLDALRMTGKAGMDIGESGFDMARSGVRAGKEFAVRNPKTASAAGGALAGGALARILGNKRPDIESLEQERRMRLMQTYGES